MEDEIKTILINKLKPKVELLGLSMADINENESLTQNGILDSFSFLEFITDLEEELHIELDFAELDPSEFTSINSLYILIKGTKK